ncbi:DUF4946 domain-containing protein [Pseudomonas mediterranea]|jgi:hypothetical protein|uniref:DUF4946 domain-containing protein n=1 Tax=Pseudomonas mediterranea TaxID=183795 RepID=A0AAX2DC46_9PSED|nr:DUF4946 domain-containing protein [Pseudomonas mediterranea]KGU86159.1 hypothetical protein N005_08920 [Pseudomonas mediterranea CFBP 5447]MBL0842833.1 DUF4946 domain-containing protein [Pseudomonas mediterranea]QHA83248.1 DUF4946 domain-containing protein [Pseudomonas mediterranea]UZD99073.1 DUF4946 domain-containing protein [Pseudomonas mediterranea]SDU52580.1 protein of unknown function [Pseudomonas mediterranea]
MIRPFLSLFVLFFAIAASASAQAAEPQVTWPQGWFIEPLPSDASSAPAAPGTSRQRATKNDSAGNAVMVMELTATPVEPDHRVNLQGVLLEMRKSIQKDFFQGGYQSVCNKIHASLLGGVAALETTCTITQNGRHVLSQTLVAALNEGRAYVLSYAGQAQVFVESQDEIQAVRNSLKL